LVGVILRVISESRNDTAPAIVNPSAQRGSQMKSASKPLALASAALSEKNRLEGHDKTAAVPAEAPAGTVQQAGPEALGERHVEEPLRLRPPV